VPFFIHDGDGRLQPDGFGLRHRLGDNRLDIVRRQLTGVNGVDDDVHDRRGDAVANYFGINAVAHVVEGHAADNDFFRALDLGFAEADLPGTVRERDDSAASEVGAL